jgi:hypothetical protein
VPGFRPTSVTIHPDVHAHYDDIEKAAKAGRRPHASIWKAFRAAVHRVKADAQWGEVIPKSAIPAHFKRAYGVTNLY